MEILSQQNLAVTIFLCQADPAGPTDQHGSEQHINQCYTTLLAPQPCKVHIIIPVNLIHWVCFVLPDTARSALHQGPAAARPLCCRQASVFFFFLQNQKSPQIIQKESCRTQGKDLCHGSRGDPHWNLMRWEWDWTRRGYWLQVNWPDVECMRCLNIQDRPARIPARHFGNI